MLRHERIPFVSYPYEWTFSMLKDAALLQLDLLLAALEHDLVLKDSTPYNVQFKGARPVFVDVGSFERLREGEPWVGYRQFCMLYLYPLLLQAVKDVPFQPWLRGVDRRHHARRRCATCCRSATASAGACSPTSSCTPGSRRATPTGRSRSSDEVKRVFKKELFVANVRKMRKLVERLDWRPAGGRLDRVRRAQQLHGRRRAAQGRVRPRGGQQPQPWNLVWDIGANNGRYSRIAAEGAKTVMAVDADQGPVELLYRDLRERGQRADPARSR